MLLYAKAGGPAACTSPIGTFHLYRSEPLYIYIYIYIYICIHIGNSSSELAPIKESSKQIHTEKASMIGDMHNFKQIFILL